MRNIAHGDPVIDNNIPACYGTGQMKLPLKYHEDHAFNWARVHPRTCFDCTFEPRCLPQQARRRRR